MTLCTTCRYYQDDFCNHPVFAISFTNGKSTPVACESARNRDGFCGPEAARWIGKSPVVPELSDS